MSRRPPTTPATAPTTGRRRAPRWCAAPPPTSCPPLADLGRVHIMGIAGSGMSALARILLERGLDGERLRGARLDRASPGCARSGATVHIGHSPAHLDDADTFVYTTAINPRHEEFVAARASGKPVLRRAAALAAALEDQRCVAIAGTHGKTSTTSLLIVGAQACGVDPSFAIGGNLYETGKNAHLGTGAFAIVEADESDGSFLLTRPVGRGRHQRRGRPSGEPRRSRGHLPRVRAVRRPHRCRTGCCSPAPTTRVRGASPSTRDERAGRCGPTAAMPDADVRVSDVVTRCRRRRVHRHGLGPAPRRVRVGALIGAHMALNATAALVLAAELGLDLDTRSGGVGGVRRRAPPLRVARRRRRGARLRRLRPPPDRDRGVADRREQAWPQPRRARRPADRGVPARHLQPHPDLRARVRRRDGARRHRDRDGHLPGPRGADPGRHRRDDQRPDRRCPPSRSSTSRATTRCPTASPSWPGPATWW